MRAKAPVYANQDIRLMGNLSEDETACDLWAVTPDGNIAMEASARFA